MNIKLRKSLSELCKDFGLTDKALDELAENGSQGLKDDSSDEDVKKVADSLVNFARMMQGEITRKTSKSKHEEEKAALLKEIEELKKKVSTPNPPEPPKTDEPEWFKSYREQQEQTIKQLKEEADKFKLEQAKRLRTEQINAKAKELGIPSFIMKNVAIADDADYEKVLSEIKQELVNNSLDGQFSDPRAIEEADKSAALDYVNSL